MRHTITREMFLEIARQRPEKMDCGTEFSLDVTHSIVVADCNSVTPAEQQTMLKGLYFKWHSQANTICAQNGDSCPSPTPTNFTEKSVACVKGSDGKSVLTIVATISGKCEPITLSQREKSVVSDDEAADLLRQIQERTQTLLSEKTPSKADLCKVYKEVKPLIEAVLPWIEKLPKGKQIAAVIRFLMKIADAVCG